MGRSTAERTVKKLLNEMARDIAIPGMKGEAPMTLQGLIRVKAEVLAAVAAWEPSSKVRKFVLSAEELGAGVARVRSRSENANRDVALIFVLLSTGAKPIEIARLQVRDYLNADGSVRTKSELRATVNDPRRHVAPSRQQRRCATDRRPHARCAAARRHVRETCLRGTVVDSSLQNRCSRTLALSDSRIGLSQTAGRE